MSSNSINKPMTVPKELNKLFGPDESLHIPSFYIKQLLRLAWSGSMCTEGRRALCWRVLLGILSDNEKLLWPKELNAQVETYKSLRVSILPSIDKNIADPLSGLISSEQNQNEEWNMYYKNVDLVNFIKGDLDRLYLSGIDDDYFHDKLRREMLLSILFIWAQQNPRISYRQGMHEILGTIFYCVDVERRDWEKAIQRKEISNNHFLFSCFSSNTIESHTFWIFEKVMSQIGALYEPVDTNNERSVQPFIVQYCTKIQEHFLRLLDPDLCDHLEESYVQAQLYGMRWSRLLLGREFPITHDHAYKLWDFMFASLYDTEDWIKQERNKVASSPMSEDDIPPNIYSMLANIRENSVNIRVPNGFASPTGGYMPGGQTTTCTPLLGALGDFMLAMLIQIRDPLMESDPSTVMGYLMRYPETPDVTPIIEYADMIRRGVIIKEAHLGGIEKKQNSYSNLGPTLSLANPFVSYQTSALGSGRNPTESAYPLNTAVDKNASNPTKGLSNQTAMTGTDPFVVTQPLNDIGRRVTTRLSAVKHGMMNLSTDLVNTIVAGHPLSNPSPDTISNIPEPSGSDGQLTPFHSDGSDDKEKSSEGSATAEVDSDPLLGVQIQNKSKPTKSTQSNEAKNKSVFTTPLKEINLNGLGTNYGGIPSASESKESHISFFAPNSWFQNIGSHPNTSSNHHPTNTIHVNSAKAKNPSTSSAVAILNGIDFPSNSHSHKRPDSERGVVLQSTISNDLSKQGSNHTHEVGANSSKVSLFHIATASTISPVQPVAASSSSKSIIRSNLFSGNRSGSDKNRRKPADCNNAVSDRLMDITNHLAHPSYLGITNSSDQQKLEYEQLLRRDTVQRLLVLVDVLSGQLSIADYDTQFGVQPFQLITASAVLMPQIEESDGKMTSDGGSLINPSVDKTNDNSGGSGNGSSSSSSESHGSDGPRQENIDLKRISSNIIPASQE